MWLIKNAENDYITTISHLIKPMEYNETPLFV